MEHHLILAFALTLIAGLSTSIGGLLSFIVKKENIAALALGLSFSAGIMIYVSFMEILPQAQHSIENIMPEKSAAIYTLVAFFIGMIIAATIDYKFPSHLSEDMLDENYKLKRAGLFTAVALAIHNFPEGLATFMAGAKDISLGIPIAAAIAIHNIPEGISVSLPIYNATGDKKKAFLYTTLSGLAEPLGAIIGLCVFGPFINDLTFGCLFALTAGIMIYISFDELLPLAREYDRGHLDILGVALGMLVMAVSLLLL